MKRGTTPTLKISLNLPDLSSIEKIDFMLKQKKDESCTTKVKKTYPSESVSLDTDTGVFSVSYTTAETRVFEKETAIWLDVRPVLTNGTVLATELVKLFVNATLFAETEE